MSEVILNVKTDCSNLNDLFLMMDYIEDGGYKFNIKKIPKWLKKDE